MQQATHPRTHARTQTMTVVPPCVRTACYSACLKQQIKGTKLRSICHLFQGVLDFYIDILLIVFLC